MLIEKCPICGSQALTIYRMYEFTKNYMPRWAVHCMDCGCYVNRALTWHGAWRKWNKNAKNTHCGTCAKQKSDECPNSALCYANHRWPYYERKKK